MLIDDMLIGRSLRIIEATDPGLRGLSGQIIDETRNLLIVDTNLRRVRIPKCCIKRASFSYPAVAENSEEGQRMEILLTGEDITGSPAERIYKKN